MMLVHQVESSEGRQWLLSQPVFTQVLESLSHLLGHASESTVNSAALILARLSLCEEACQSQLTHLQQSRSALITGLMSVCVPHAQLN